MGAKSQRDLSISTPTIKKSLISILFLSLLALASYWRSLSFDFWRDDWGVIWTNKLYPPLIWGPNWQLHPLHLVEAIVFYRIAGENPIIWNVLGFILRVISSFTIYLMIARLTGSKRIGVLAGVFYASTYAALETVSWRTAQHASTLIIFLTLGFYFWFEKLEVQKKRVWGYILGAFLFVLSILSDPGRAIEIIFLIPFLELSFWFSLKNADRLNSVLKRIILILIIILVTYRLTYVGSTYFFDQLGIILTNFPDIRFYLASIGNLAVGWLIRVSEFGSLTLYYPSRAVIGFLFLYLSVVFLVFSFLFRKRILFLLSFFVFWVGLFYFPNWFFERTLTIAGSHRYFAIASVGLVSIVAIVVGSMKNFRFAVVLATIFVLLNIMTSNRILEGESKHRSVTLINSLWDEIDKTVGDAYKRGDTVFMIDGGGDIRGSIFDWSYSVPFGIRHNISEPDRLPIFYNDTGLVLDLLCKENVERPSLGSWTKQLQRIPIERIFYWKFDGTNLRDDSPAERIILTRLAEKVRCRVLHESYN